MISLQKIGFWLGVFFVSLLVMMRPASAAQVNPSIMYYGFGPGASSCAAFCDLVATDAWPTPKFCSSSNVDAGNVCTFVISSAGILYPRGPISPTYTCPAGYTYNASINKCETTVCPTQNTPAVSGLFDIGTNPNQLGPGLLNGCGANNCETVLGALDPISRRGIIGGQTHYFAVGVIVFSGQTCNPGTPAVPTTKDPNIPQTCGAGEQAVTGANGYFACFKDGTNTASSSVPTTTTTTTTGTTTTTDQTTGASSVSTTTTTSESTTRDGAGASGSMPADQLKDYCATTPTAEICKQGQPAATVSAPAVSGLYPGDLNATGHQTVSDVVGTFKTRITNSPVGSAVSGFFNVSIAGGACPVWTTNAPMIGTITFDIYCQSMFQEMLPWIKSIILIIFSFVAFRIAIL